MLIAVFVVAATADVFVLVESLEFRLVERKREREFLKIVKNLVRNIMFCKTKQKIYYFIYIYIKKKKEKNNFIHRQPFKITKKFKIKNNDQTKAIFFVYS